MVMKRHLRRSITTFIRNYTSLHWQWSKPKKPLKKLQKMSLSRYGSKESHISAIHNLRVYLYIATKNTALNYLSKKAKENLTEPFDNIHIDLYKSSVTPEELMITSEMYRKIQVQVEALPPRCKMIFKLIREDGLKYKEVSDILNISVNTIDVQIAIAIKKIAIALKPEYDFWFKTNPNLRDTKIAPQDLKGFYRYFHGHRTHLTFILKNRPSFSRWVEFSCPLIRTLFHGR